jgi:CBS domain-containing membrane protein
MKTELHTSTLDQTGHFRHLLLQRRGKILASEETLKKNAFEELLADGAGEISKLRSHPADLATDTQEVEILQSLSAKNIKTLQEVEDALVRLDQGNYGQCLSCQEPISPRRLEVLPETKYCIECEQDMEDQQKRGPAKGLASSVRAPSQRNSPTLNLLELTVGDLMRDDPIAVRLHETVHVAAQLLADHHIRHLPVVDAKGDIQGIISDRDLLNAAFRSRPWRLTERVENPWMETSVRAVMTKNPETVTPETKLIEAGTLLLENKISSLPVVEGNHLIGIITESDFVKLICQEL